MFMKYTLKVYQYYVMLFSDVRIFCFVVVSGNIIFLCHQGYLFETKKKYTVDSRYLEIEGTLKNSPRYPYFDISDL